MLNVSRPVVLLCLLSFSCKDRTAANLSSAPRPGDAETSFTDASKNLTHYTGPFSIAGKYALNPQTIRQRYKVPDEPDIKKNPLLAIYNQIGLDPSFLGLDYKVYGTMLLFPVRGNTPITTPSGKKKYVRDIQYFLGNGRVGIRPFPAVEPATMPVPGPGVPYVDISADTTAAEGQLATANIPNASIQNGEIVVEPSTSQVTRLNDLDSYIMNHVQGDPLKTSEIFALTTYTHPEEYFGGAVALPPLKLQGAYSHMGSYFGRGFTRNSPFDFEKHKIWERYGTYPVDITEVRFKEGVSRRVTNMNTRIYMSILNGNGDKKYSVQFPKGGYKFDWLLMSNLANHLHFLAAWLDDTYPVTVEYTDKNGVTTTVPWTTAVKTLTEYATYCAEHVTASLNLGFNLPFNEAAFVEAYGNEALGKRLFKLAQDRYTLVAGKLPDVPNFQPLYKQNNLQGKAINITKDNDGLVWPLQSTVDFVANLIEQYTAWPDVGAAATAATIFGLKDELKTRLSMEDAEYFGEYGFPAIGAAFVYEAMTQVGKTKGVTFEVYKSTQIATIQAMFGRNPAVASNLSSVVTSALDKAEGTLKGQNEPITQEAGWEGFRTDMKSIIQKGRNRQLNCKPGVKCVKWYAPPSVAHRISIGIHEANPLIAVETMGTIFDPADLVKISNDPNSVIDIDMQVPKVISQTIP